MPRSAKFRMLCAAFSASIRKLWRFELLFQSPMKIVLASASPRRAQILSNAGIAFETLATEIDESREPGEAVEAFTCRLAESKARASLAKLKRSCGPAIVIGADTVVELDGAVFGKPGSPEAAREMLQRLSGKTHRVVTGVAAIVAPEGKITRIEPVVTRV